MAQSPLNIAWFSPLSREHSLRSAAFTRAMLRAAPEHWNIELFVDDEEWLQLRAESWAAELDGYPVKSFQTSFLRDEGAPFDHFVFHLENDARCMFVQNAMAVTPGIVFFHDLNLSRLGVSPFYFSEDSSQTEKLFGEVSGSVEDWEARGWSVEIFQQQYPVGDLQLHQAAVPVVFDSRSVDEVAQRGVRVPAAQSAFPVSLPELSATEEARELYRERLGYSDTDFVIGYNGRFGIEDRIHSVFDALIELERRKRQNGKTYRLLWLVSSEEAERDALGMLRRKELLAPQLEPLVQILTVNHQEAFQGVLAALDVFWGPKFDALRGPSLALLSALSKGVPSLVSDFGPSAEMYGDAVLKIPLGPEEAGMFAAATEEVNHNPALSGALHAAARAHIETVCSPGAVVADLEAIFRENEKRLASLHREVAEHRRGFEHQLLQGLYSELSKRERLGSLSLELPLRVGERAREAFCWMSEKEPSR